VSEAAFQENRLVSSGWLAGLTGAYLKSAGDYMALASTATLMATRPFALAQAASAFALDHDPERASQVYLQGGRLSDATFYEMEALGGYYALPAFDIAAARGDWPAALAALREEAAAIEAGKASHPALSLLQPVLIRPLQALAMARTGDIAGARLTIESTALDCYRCLRVRGQVAIASNDWALSERWFAAAIHQAPQVPFAYEELGEARLARGELHGAIAAFQAASAREPRFADPLKGWGDALARQGRWRDALSKYDAALKHAPHWSALKLAREAAARHAS
jgi:tetratricopeptide (TPR) repeat protein